MNKCHGGQKDNKTMELSSQAKGEQPGFETKFYSGARDLLDFLPI